MEIFFSSGWDPTSHQAFAAEDNYLVSIDRFCTFAFPSNSSVKIGREGIVSRMIFSHFTYKKTFYVELEKNDFNHFPELPRSAC